MTEPTVLITGFGPFPGARFNPTGPLVRRLGRLRRPALASMRRVIHVFPTSYAAVDRELPLLLRRHQPVALLMFGLSTRTPHLRVETRARNAVAILPDARGVAPRGRTIAKTGPSSRRLAVPATRLLTAARAARVPAALSREPGRYLCNYLCWRAAEAAGPVAFVHVPPIRGSARRRSAAYRRRLALDDLVRAGTAMLVALIAASRH